MDDLYLTQDTWLTKVALKALPADLVSNPDRMRCFEGILTHNDVSNLWVQPLTGREPMTINQFTLNGIVIYAWSSSYRTNFLVTPL